MAPEVWTLLLALLLPALGHAQSGGGETDGDPDAEPDVPDKPDVPCFSEISLKVNYLTCSLPDDPIGTQISLRSEEGNPMCWNSTLNGSYFTAVIDNILAKHILTIQGKERIDINMIDIVKLPPPQNITATYLKNSGDVKISCNGYRHDFVKHFNFLVQIWNATSRKNYTYSYEDFIIEREQLGDVKTGSQFSVRALVKPGGNYFSGPWSDWSHTENFTVDRAFIVALLVDGKDGALLYSIIFSTIAILLLGICLITRFRRKELKAYILPNVPHPKTTLVHMQKFNKGLLLNFNPEIFSDLHINQLDEAGEDKPLAESTDGRGADNQSRCPSQLSQVLLWQVPPGDGSSDGSQCTLRGEDGPLEDRRDWADVSSAGLRFLGEAAPTVDSGHSSGDPSLTSTCVPQRECKDEAYVTMSCLFKTQ
ncbi:interleukin-7 receptor subunit alpha [Alosa sapidissima]|uniref:interleukin-7 receptor subunit alpha n=1 Tax=Alosa sapidissima TaxID=34773 RepID=UPI001C08B5AB|nr:interleukin-7 receptor subunit alpha [Alosa sapidissima]